jgi:hypothetical protein
VRQRSSQSLVSSGEARQQCGRVAPVSALRAARPWRRPREPPHKQGLPHSAVKIGLSPHRPDGARRPGRDVWQPVDVVAEALLEGEAPGAEPGPQPLASTLGLLRGSLPIGFLLLAAVVSVVVAALVVAGVPRLTSGLIVMMIVILGASPIAAETC